VFAIGAVSAVGALALLARSRGFVLPEESTI
jgi:hypothetical protein